MPWTPSAGTSVGTWLGSADSSVGTWSGSTFSGIGWQQLSSVTESDGGVDFVLRVHDQFPLAVNDGRPSYIIDDIEAP